MPFVYILRCGDGSVYTGVAKNLQRRVAQHIAGRASRYTRSHQPVALAWAREVGTWARALEAERRIKALRRAEKDALIRSGLPGGRARRFPRREPPARRA